MHSNGQSNRKNNYIIVKLEKRKECKMNISLKRKLEMKLKETISKIVLFFLYRGINIVKKSRRRGVKRNSIME